MRQFSEHDLTDAVIEQLAECDDPRFKTVMTSLVKHLHDFVQDVELSEAEWLAAIRFLTDVGQACDGRAPGVHPAFRHARGLDPGRRDQSSHAQRRGRIDHPWPVLR
jgi:hypothetical protein